MFFMRFSDCMDIQYHRLGVRVQATFGNAKAAGSGGDFGYAARLLHMSAKSSVAE